MRFVFALCMLVLATALAAPASAAADGAGTITLAQADGKSLIGPRPSDEAGRSTPGWWTRAAIWMRMQQQALYKQLTGALKAVKETNSVAAGWGLVAVSFLYGIFHAAGPGHGKAVISAWLVANERQLRRGIALAFMSSAFQALTAIVLVSAVLLLARAAFASAREMTVWLELTSYALIAALGAAMLWRAVRRLLPRPAPTSLGAAAVDHHNDHDHHDHVHGPDCGCGHAHMPGPDAVAGRWSLGRALAIAMAVGIRPCSGAVIVLLFANTMGLYAAGIGATLAMALGTAITVSVIAVAAVGSKNLALRLAGPSGVWLERTYTALGIAAGLAILALGTALFIATLNAPRPII